MGRPRERILTNNEYLAIKNECRNGITDELVFAVADFKIYSMLANAKHRTLKRSEYKGVMYQLGEYKYGLSNMKKYRPDLYKKFFEMIRKFIVHNFENEYAPTIHRLEKNYTWATIDILPDREHKEIDNAKEIIIRNINDKKLKTKGEPIPLTMEIITKMAEGRKFPSKTKAVEFLVNTYGVSKKIINRNIDTGEIIKTDNIEFEILEAENKDKVTKIKMEKNYEDFKRRYPHIYEMQQNFKETMENYNKCRQQMGLEPEETSLLRWALKIYMEKINVNIS